MSDSFINKYRPVSFDQMYGHEVILAKLLDTLTPPSRPHTYLFTGESGLGKTTLARLIGLWLEADVTELDAASHSGVDDMREIVELSQYMSLQGGGNRLYIIDECHTLSRNAWQALLKLAEEPPEHFYLALCTTEPTKVPDTIRGQRAYQVALRPLPLGIMEAYIAAIAELEYWTISNDIFNVILQNAGGSPRKALRLMELLHDVPDREHAKPLLSALDAGETLIQVGQVLLRGKADWRTLRPMLDKINDDAFDAAISQLGNYLVATLCRTDNVPTMLRAADLITALTFPTDTYNKKLHFYSAIARMVQV